MEKMTVHRALAELKLIDNKIVKNMEDIVPVSYKQGDKGLVGTLWTQEEFTTNAQGRYDSAIALLERKVKIKSAIVKSNSKTQVTIGDKTMSVADAIAYKGVLALKKDFAKILRQKYNNTVATVSKNNDIVKNNVQKLLEMTFGKDSIKAGAGDIEAVRAPYMTANEVHLVDPLGIANKIEDLEKEIGTFEADVDAILSESNALTFIEVE